MTTQYFRLTVYHPTEDLSGIMDSNGMFEKLWQFSSYLIQKGFKILEASADEKFLDVNIGPAEPAPNNILLRAAAKGKPENIIYKLGGITYRAIKIDGKIYIPDRDKTENAG